jgi:hypothetical protein
VGAEQVGAEQVGAEQEVAEQEVAEQVAEQQVIEQPLHKQHRKGQLHSLIGWLLNHLPNLAKPQTMLAKWPDKQAKGLTKSQALWDSLAKALFQLLEDLVGQHRPE